MRYLVKSTKVNSLKQTLDFFYEVLLENFYNASYQNIVKILDVEWILDLDTTSYITNNLHIITNLILIFVASLIDASGEPHHIINKDLIFINYFVDQIKYVENVLFILSIKHNPLLVGHILEKWLDIYQTKLTSSYI